MTTPTAISTFDPDLFNGIRDYTQPLISFDPDAEDAGEAPAPSHIINAAITMRRAANSISSWVERQQLETARSRTRSANANPVDEETE